MYKIFEKMTWLKVIAKNQLQKENSWSFFVAERHI